MAKGTSIDKRKQGSLNKARVWSSEISSSNNCHQYYQSRTSVFTLINIPTSKVFKTKHREEYKNTCVKSIYNLEKDTLKIFEECLHTDLYILHETKVLQLNSCIFKTRSPRLYNVLKNKYFEYNSNNNDNNNNNCPIKCYLNIPEIYHQITWFVRLLYCNLDVTEEEQRLIDFIYCIENKLTSDINDSLDINIINNNNNRSSNAVVLSPSTSDMADSGLETGSVSLHDNTESENSATDVEESHVTDYVSTDDDFIRVTVSGDVERSNKNTLSHHHHRKNSDWCDRDPIRNVTEETGNSTISVDVSCGACGADKSRQPSFYCDTHAKDESSSKTSATSVDIDDITRYENEVLNDPFYESDSNDNEQSSSFIPTGSFEFIEPGSLSPTGNTLRQGYFNDTATNNDDDDDDDDDDDKNNSSFKTQSMIVENSYRHTDGDLVSHSNTHGLKNNTNSSNNSNNYYFIDASTLSDDNEVTCLRKNDCHNATASLPAYLENANYIPSGSDALDGKKKVSVHETTAEFEREIKLTIYSKPAGELRKIKCVDSLPDEKSSEKAIEKEALVVEIKEADSGESNHPSPCIDNNKKAQYEHSSSKETHNNSASMISMNIDNNNRGSQQSLVRCNTFELDSGDEKLSHLRQDQERRQGNLVFKNSIPQYSAHRVDNDLTFNGKNYPSVSYFTSEQCGDQSKRTGYQSSRTNKIYSLSQTANTSRSFNNEDSHYQSADELGLYPITKSASDKFLGATTEIDDNSLTDCNSLPITLDSTKANHQNTMKRTKRDEMTPIVSGGVSTIDYSRPTDSPTVRRKTETTPIVSGGSVITNYPVERVNKPARMSSSMSTWIVDMSDCKNNLRSTNGSSSSNMSQSYSFSDSANNNNKHNTRQAKADKGSLGFFVNLKDINNPKQTSLKQTTSDHNYHHKNDKELKQSCEFFVDISKDNVVKCCKDSDKLNGSATNSNNNNNNSNSSSSSSSNSKGHISGESGEKKNIFSMFIDLNDKPSDKKKCDDEEKSMREKKLHRLQQNRNSNSSTCTTTVTTTATASSRSSCNDSSSSSNEVRLKDKKSSGVFMFIESDSPVVRRRTLSTSRPSVLQRHSWNVDKSQSQDISGGNSSNNDNNSNGHTKDSVGFCCEHKRAHSVSIEPGTAIKLLVKSSSSSVSLNQADKIADVQHQQSELSSLTTQSMKANTSFDRFESEVRDTPPNSHIEINDGLRCEYKDMLRASTMCSSAEASIDTKIFEDDQSEVSGWDKTATESTEGHTRKSETFDISSGSVSGPSPGSDNHDFDLDNYRNSSKFKDRCRGEAVKSNKISETHKSLTETIKKIECEFDKPEYSAMETSCEELPSDSCTKVGESKQSKGQASCSGFVRLSDLDKTPVKSVAEPEESITSRSLPYRMSSSIPEMSWVESKLAVNRTSGPCPVRMVSSRKFTSIMSTSLPAKHKSPIEEFGPEIEGDGIVSESDLSSMQSSMGRSGADVSTEETETSSFTNAKPHNRLGEDLLRMFLEEINPDVTIDVGGRRIRAHKCILSSRCQYFAAILSGGWIENAGNVIALQGFSYASVHFALCHIYSGESNIPDSISILELATLADMLCLEGLKEVISYTIKVKYCHLFHKPCQQCAVGVLECMVLAATFGLDEIYRKSLRWVTRHFVRIWPCKAFAVLPRELMDKCYHQHIVHMSTDNILQTIMDCDKLLATLPNVRWAEPVFRMVSNLLEASLKFLSENFSGVLSNDSFQALGRDLTWNISRLEDNVLSAADRLPPDQACKSYAKLHKMLSVAGVDDVAKPSWGSLFVDFLEKIQVRVEKRLVKDASRAARTTTWLKMDLELRRRIQELACLVILPHEALKRPLRNSNFSQKSKITTNRTTANRNLDLKKVKMTFTEQNNKTVKPSTVQTIKKILPKPKSDPMERKMPDVKTLASDSGIRPKSWPNKLEVKSRYLEPRIKSATKELTHQQSSLPERVTVQQRRKIMISSSDSSRTSSPAMKRAVDKKPITKLKIAAKKDVKALSSDSLADSTGIKSTPNRDGASKSCGITRPESPSLQVKESEIGLSVDSLAESKKKAVPEKKTTAKMDTSMSTDSLMTEVTTPKSVVSNKVSPTLGRPTAKSLAMAKKSSTPTNPRSPLSLTRRITRSVESSTAASRNRVAAISAYHGSPNLRRNLLDAAKTPDTPTAASKITNGILSKSSLRQSLPSTSTPPVSKRDKKDSNPSSSESPSKRSPKSNGVNRPNRVMQSGIKKNVSTVAVASATKSIDEQKKLKCHSGDTPKQLTVGSRSGTFLKDEPTILKKSDMKTSQVMS